MPLITEIILGDGLIGTQGGTSSNTVSSSGTTIQLDPAIKTTIEEITVEIEDLADILTNYSGGLFGGYWG